MRALSAPLLVVFLASCASRLPEPTWRPAPEPSLEGGWLLELQVVGKYSGREPRRAKGRVHFHCKSTAPAEALTGPCPTQYEVSIRGSELHRFFGPEVYGAPWAKTRANGLTELVVNPRIDHGSFGLRGMARGDSVVGEWARGNMVDDGYRGRFVLSRES